MKTKLVKFIEIEDFKKLQNPLMEKAKIILKKDKLTVEDKINFRDFVVVNLMYACALRVSEVCNLKMQYLDIEKKYLYVVNGKGGDRIVPIPKQTVDLILKWLKIRPNDNKSEYVFCSVKWHKRGIDKPLIPQYYNRLFNKLAEESGVRMRDGSKPHPHTLRHSRAMEIYDNGVELEVLQKLLGHKSVGTTQIYAQVRDKKVMEIQQSITDGLIKL